MNANEKTAEAGGKQPEPACPVLLAAARVVEGSQTPPVAAHACLRGRCAWWKDGRCAVTDGHRRDTEARSDGDDLQEDLTMDDAIRDADAFTRLSQELRTRKLRGDPNTLGAVDAALAAIDRLTKERDELKQKVAELNSRGSGIDDSLYDIHIALAEAGHPILGCPPGPDAGDDGITQVDCVKALAQERDVARKEREQALARAVLAEKQNYETYQDLHRCRSRASRFARALRQISEIAGQPVPDSDMLEAQCVVKVVREKIGSMECLLGAVQVNSDLARGHEIEEELKRLREKLRAAMEAASIDGVDCPRDPDDPEQWTRFIEWLKAAAGISKDARGSLLGGLMGS